MLDAQLALVGLLALVRERYHRGLGGRELLRQPRLLLLCVGKEKRGGRERGDRSGAMVVQEAEVGGESRAVRDWTCLVDESEPSELVGRGVQLPLHLLDRDLRAHQLALELSHISELRGARQAGQEPNIT